MIAYVCLACEYLLTVHENELFSRPPSTLLVVVYIIFLINGNLKRLCAFAIDEGMIFMIRKQTYTLLLADLFLPRVACCLKIECLFSALTDNRRFGNDAANTRKCREHQSLKHLLVCRTNHQVNNVCNSSRKNSGFSRTQRQKMEWMIEDSDEEEVAILKKYYTHEGSEAQAAKRSTNWKSTGGRKIFHLNWIDRETIVGSFFFLSLQWNSFRHFLLVIFAKVM